MADTGVVDGQRTTHPWLLSFVTALAVSLVGAVLLPMEGETFGYSWGSHFGMLLIPALGVGLLLRYQSWPWWAAVGVAAAVFVVVLVALALFRAALDQLEERDSSGSRTSPTSSADDATDDGADDSAGDEDPEDAAGPVDVYAPQTVGGWGKLGGRLGRQARAQSDQQLALLPDGYVEGRPAVGIYRRGSATAVLVVFAVGAELQRDFEIDARQGAVEFVSGATGDQKPEIVPAGPLGGGAACTAENPMDGAVICGWADKDTLGQLTLVGAGESMGDVVPVLHLFRAAALGR